MEEIKTKIVGVTAKNEDGQSRQVIINKLINEYDTLDLEPEPTEKNPDAVAVYVYPAEGKKYRVGYINPTLAPRILTALAEDMLIVCMVMAVTGRGTDELGLDCEITISTRQEVKAEAFAMREKSQKEYRQKRYGLKAWRAWVGIPLFFLGILLIFSVKGIAGWLTGLAIFILPSVFLLLPWWRWVYDQVAKLFARKHIQ